MTATRHAFSLQLTERCNLACRYCYVRRRRQPDPIDCTPDLCERFVDFALRESGGRVKITFFGGEPLLRPDLIRHTVACGRQAAARRGATAIGFHLVTNGTLLDDELGDFIAAEGIGLEVSLDGPEKIHDANRRFTDGAPSFRRIYGNLLRFVERHPDHPVSIFSVITSADALPWLQALCRGLETEGLTFNPARLGPGEKGRASCRRTTAQALGHRIDAHREAFLRGATGTDEGMNEQMACLLGAEEPHRCEAGINATIATRTGAIYPCPFFVGHEDQVIGNIASGFDPDRAGPFVARALEGMRPCGKCRARRVCGAGCAFDAYERTGRIDMAARDACAASRAYARRLEASITTLAARRPERLLEKTIGTEHDRVPAASVHCRTAAPRNFVVRLTGRCNLACDYCYEKKNGTDTDHLDRPTAQAIVKHILEGPAADPLVCLFGGEPLLNWQEGEFLIEEIARGAQRSGKRPCFHLTTNGTLMTPEIARTVARHAITVQVSIDGPREQHDRHRKYRDGSGSYEAMLGGVEMLRGASPDARIDGQVVLTPGNVDMAAIAGHLKSIGFRRLSFLVAGWEDNTGICWTDEDLEALERAREAFFPFSSNRRFAATPKSTWGLRPWSRRGPMALRGSASAARARSISTRRPASTAAPSSMRRGSPRSARAFRCRISGKRISRPAGASTRTVLPAGPGPDAAGAAWSATSAAPGSLRLSSPNGKKRGAIFSGRNLRGRRWPIGFSKAAVPGAHKN